MMAARACDLVGGVALTTLYFKVLIRDRSSTPQFGWVHGMQAIQNLIHVGPNWINNFAPST